MELASKPKANILISYAYLDEQRIEFLSKKLTQGVQFRFLLDSGAFTAANAGKVITLDQYQKFLSAMPVKPWRYFALDVVGDEARTMANYREMLANGFNPIPIFTAGSDPKIIDELYETSDVVGFGGLVGQASDSKKYIQNIMARVGTRRCHWLGFTSMDYIKHYRPYMCDSSGFSSLKRFGVLQLYAGGGKMVKVHRNDFYKRPKKDVCDLIKTYGIDVNDLAKEQNWRGGVSLASFLSAYSYLRMSLDVEKNVQTKLFLATATSTGLDQIFKAYELETKK